MNAFLLLACAALVADPFPIQQATYFDAESYVEELVRAQSSDTYQVAQGDFFRDWADKITPSGGSPPTDDPFAAGTPAGTTIVPELGTMPVPGLAFGISGPQPYRFGWTSRYDVGFLPAVGVSGGGATGTFGIFEFNAALRYTTGASQGFSNLIFSVTPEFNYRSWSGPGNPGLPPNVYRFAGDFELATPGNYPVSLQLGFTPAFVSDFSANPNSDAFNYDVRGAVFLQASPQWMIVAGAAYWHRVDDFLIPYAGVVWTPNDRWELRLLFPKSRISYFLGNWMGASTWAYGGVEYGVEAYQINLASPYGGAEKIQLADYRLLLGLRAESGGVTGFAEVGCAFDRQVDFLHGTPGFDINTGFIGRIGLRF